MSTLTETLGSKSVSPRVGSNIISALVAPPWAPLTSRSRGPPSLHFPVCLPHYVWGNPAGDLYLKTSWMDGAEEKSLG